MRKLILLLFFIFIYFFSFAQKVPVTHPLYQQAANNLNEAITMSDTQGQVFFAYSKADQALQAFDSLGYLNDAAYAKLILAKTLINTNQYARADLLLKEVRSDTYFEKLTPDVKAAYYAQTGSLLYFQKYSKTAIDQFLLSKKSLDQLSNFTLDSMQHYYPWPQDTTRMMWENGWVKETTLQMEAMVNFMLNGAYLELGDSERALFYSDAAMFDMEALDMTPQLLNAKFNHAGVLSNYRGDFEGCLDIMLPLIDRPLRNHQDTALLPLMLRMVGSAKLQMGDTLSFYQANLRAIDSIRTHDQDSWMITGLMDSDLLAMSYAKLAKIANRQALEVANVYIDSALSYVSKLYDPKAKGIFYGELTDYYTTDKDWDKAQQYCRSLFEQVTLPEYSSIEKLLPEQTLFLNDNKSMEAVLIYHRMLKEKNEQQPSKVLMKQLWESTQLLIDMMEIHQIFISNNGLAVLRSEGSVIDIHRAYHRVIYKEGLDLLYELSKIDDSKDYLNEMHQLHEQGESFLNRQLLVHQLYSDTDWYDKVSALNGDRYELRQKLKKAKGDERIELKRKIVAVNLEIDQLHRSFEEKVLNTKVNTPDLTKIQKVYCKKKKIVHQWMIGNKQIYLIIIDEHNIELKNFSIDKIETIQAFGKALRQPGDTKEVFKKGKQFYDTFLKNHLNIQVKNKEIVILPDGPLYNISYDAIPFDYSKNYSGEPSDLDLLVYHYATRTAFTASSLDMNQTNSLSNKKINLSFFEPTYSAVGDQRKLTNLIFSSDQFISTSNTNKYSMSLKKEATKADFANYLEKNLVDVAVINAHGIINLSDPLNSSVEFTWAGNQASSQLTARELYFSKLKTNLVILNACQSGDGKVVSGVGLQSLAKSFRIGGAKTLLINQWSPNNGSNDFLLTKVIRQLLETQELANSLREAKVKYLESDEYDVEQRHPYYWAGFSIIGSGM